MTTSVAVCTYNGEKYIEEQLNSIIQQSIKPNQIVISDDNSSDNTVEIAKEILEKSGINYIINVNKPNLGITENFDKAFSLCTGDIIFPSDQDNVWFENYIQEFLLAFQKIRKQYMLFVVELLRMKILILKICCMIMKFI